MVVGTVKATDATEAVAVEAVDVVAIQIAPTKPGTMLVSKVFIGISAVLIGMPLRCMVKHTPTVNVDVGGLGLHVVMAAHMEDVVVVEDVRFQKLILIGINLAMEEVTMEDAAHNDACFGGGVYLLLCCLASATCWLFN